MRGVTRHSEHPLLDVLKTRDEGLYRQAQHLITRAKEILPHVLSTFPSGTAHGPEHTTTVEAISHLMIAGDFISKLSDRELFFHVLSCHFHDLGMVGTEADNESRDSRDQVRRDHAVRIAERFAPAGKSWASTIVESLRFSERFAGGIGRDGRRMAVQRGTI